MGLDMYLYRHPKGETKAQRDALQRKLWKEGFEAYHEKYSKVREIAYWRKVNFLHGYIVKEYAGGEDECQEIPLDIEDIKSILDRGVVTFATKSDIEKFIDYEKAKALSLAGAPLRGFTEANPDKMGIYLHWNGGVSSIRAFIEAAKRLDIRDGISDNSYCIARLAQVIGNFFGGTLSLGVGTLNRLDCNNYDNGVYVVTENWEIIGREFASYEDEDEYDLEGFVAEILGNMPESYQSKKERK